MQVVVRRKQIHPGAVTLKLLYRRTHTLFHIGNPAGVSICGSSYDEVPCTVKEMVRTVHPICETTKTQSNF